MHYRPHYYDDDDDLADEFRDHDLEFEEERRQAGLAWLDRLIQEEET